MASDDLMEIDDQELDLPKPGPKRAGALAGLALVLALGALVLAGLSWWEGRAADGATGPDVEAGLDRLQQAQAGQAERLAEFESRLEAASGAREAADSGAIESALEDQQAKNVALRQELESQQSYARSLQQAIEAMQARLIAVETGLAAKSPGRLDAPEQLDLAGVAYLLRLAPERLTLFHDLRSADQALALADVRLAGMDNPIYIGLRQRIADARQALMETEVPNPVEISARLDAIQADIVGLDFRAAGQPGPSSTGTAEGPESAEQGWWARLKTSLASLVTVRRNVSDTDTRLTLEDKDMLRQGLWMQMEAARLALMRQDQAVWDDAVARAGEALDRWFDSASPEYTAVREGLDALANTVVSPDLPDISGPWAQFQLLRQAPKAPLPVPAPAGEAVDEPAADAGTEGDEAPAGASEPDQGQ